MTRFLTRLGELTWNAQGSSRSSGLIRIGLALIVWARYSRDLLYFRDMSVEYAAVVTVFYLASTSMLLGLRSRVSTAVTGVVLMVMYWHYGRGQGDPHGWIHHHTYLLNIMVCLCAFTPCDRSFSLDRVLALRRARRTGEAPPPEFGHIWGLRLMALQLSVVYLWTAVDKMNYTFLSGSQLERIFMYYYFGSDYPQSPLFHLFCLSSAWITVVLEIVLPIGLWFRRARRWLVPLGLILHALFYLMIPVSTYTVTVWVIYLAFIDPATIHRWTDELMGGEPGKLQPASATT